MSILQHGSFCRDLASGFASNRKRLPISSNNVASCKRFACLADAPLDELDEMYGWDGLDELEGSDEVGWVG